MWIKREIIPIPENKRGQEDEGRRYRRAPARRKRRTRSLTNPRFFYGFGITQQIQDLVKVRPCVLLTGARQTGKSSLLEKSFSKYKYVSLDVPNLASEAKENGNYFLEKNGEPIIIDEIQYAPELFRFLKIEIDKKRNQFKWWSRPSRQ